MQPLAPLNATLELAGTLPGDTWTEWLWRCDPEEPLHPRLLMNRSHLLGLLMCRHEGLKPPPATLGGVDGRMALMDKAPRDMSLRELRDTVDNVLTEWPPFLHRVEQNPDGARNLRAVLALVDGCFARFGVLAGHAASLEVMDDATCVEEHGEGLGKLTRTFMRRMLGTFLVLYRHFHLLCKAVQVAPIPYDCQIHKHHMEASNDDFHVLCMHMRLPVAGRLNYKHDFPGMYNHVSQAIYFHNPQYERTQRIRLDQVPEGEPVQVLPAIRQIQPEIGTRYEEDQVDLSRGLDKWLWIVLPGRVYLAAPDSKVYYSSNITALLGVYREQQAQKA